MNISKKSWKYQNGNDEILVQYDYNLSFNNASVKTIKLNDEIIFQSNLSCIQLEEKDKCSFEKDKLKVFLGLHLRCIRRCHIYIDNKLVGGDVDKQIYMPHMAFKMFICISSIMGLLVLFMSLYAIAGSFFSDLDLKKRVVADDLNLNQKEVCSFFQDNKNHDYKKDKYLSWSKKCEEGQPEFCRLNSYLYCAERLQRKAFPLALKGCQLGSVISCFAAYDNVTANHRTPEYNEITNRLKTFCIEPTIKNERQGRICREFSWTNSRVSGDVATMQIIAKQLCAQKNEESCKDIKWLDHQKDGMCLTGNCKDIYN